MTTPEAATPAAELKHDLGGGGYALLKSYNAITTIRYNLNPHPYPLIPLIPFPSFSTPASSPKVISPIVYKKSWDEPWRKKT